MTEFSKIPNTQHYAIITTSTITIPGDERSRTNPGHGYPESTETVINYEAFTDKDEWERRIETLAKRPYSHFKAMVVHPAKIETKVSVVL